MSKEVSCGNCWFWKVWPKVRPTGPLTRGECHRYPPTVICDLEDGGAWDRWVCTNADEWCGEYRPKEE